MLFELTVFFTLKFRARGCLKRGEELDYVKTSGLIFDDFRGGKIGRITLEWAGQQENN